MLVASSVLETAACAQEEGMVCRGVHTTLLVLMTAGRAFADSGTRNKGLLRKETRSRMTTHGWAVWVDS